MKLLSVICTARDVFVAFAFATVLNNANGEFAYANPYLGKAGEPVIKARVGNLRSHGRLHSLILSSQ